MSKSKPEDRQLEPVSKSNPFCPVCGESDGKVPSATAGSRPGEVEAHSCLLSIINAHYLLSKKEMGESK